MEQDIFKAGVRPGSPTNFEEIKILVCYILTKQERSMTFGQIHETLQEHDLVNYFELVRAVDGLLKSGHIRLAAGEPAEAYAATELGKTVTKEFEKALPASVRDKVVAAAERILKREQREREVRIQIHEADGGYRMELAIPQDGGTLVSFQLFLPTREECELVRRRFLNDPLFIYQGVLALLTGNDKVLGEIFPQDERLF